MGTVISAGAGWRLGNGTSVRFWSDNWVGNSNLIDKTSQTVPTDHLHRSVSSYWGGTSGWNWDGLNGVLSENSKLEIAAFVVSEDENEKDELVWPRTNDGTYSVSSAYKLLGSTQLQRAPLDGIYNRIWSLRVPERAKIFLWQVTNQAIMTNAERKRRKLGDTDACTVCEMGVESITHVLRDCAAIEGVWRQLIPNRYVQNFFHEPLLNWIYLNLKQDGPYNTENWATTYALTVWWSWKWRCTRIFGDGKVCRDKVNFLRKAVKDSIKAHDMAWNTTAKPNQRIQEMISWVRPPPSWVTLNTDGASRGNPGLATAGGAIRNHEGNWMGGFTYNIGICSVTKAELWGAYHGLRTAWDLGFKQVQLQMDSTVAISFLKNGVNDSHPLAFLVRLCHGFLIKIWCIRFRHVFREANRLADGLANCAFVLPLGYHFCDTAPDAVVPLLLEDAAGLAHPRLILNLMPP